MTDDISQLADLAGIFAGAANGPHPPCRLCGDLIGWSAGRGEGDVCRNCAATIADPETLRTLARWFDNPCQTKAVACELGGRKYTLGMIFRDVADAIEAQAGARIASPDESAADRSAATAAAGVPMIDTTNGRGANDDEH